jgi:hypothetical protein
LFLCVAKNNFYISKEQVDHTWIVNEKPLSMSTQRKIQHSIEGWKLTDVNITSMNVDEVKIIEWNEELNGIQQHNIYIQEKR